MNCRAFGPAVLLYLNLMIVIIIIAVAFYQYARRKELVPIVWALLGAGAYFAGQFIAAYLLVMLAADVVIEQASLIGVSLLGGLAAVLILWIIMMRTASKKVQGREEELDNNRYLEEL